MARDRGSSRTQESRFSGEASKEELVEIRNIDIPDLLYVGEAGEVTVSVRNTAGFVNPLDPDVCVDVAQGSGYTLDVQFTSGSLSVRDNACVGTNGGVKEFTFEFGPFDSPGVKPATVSVTTANSERTVATRQIEANVVSRPDGGDDGEDGSDDDGDGDGGNDDGGGGDDTDDGQDEPGSCPEGQVYSYKDETCKPESEAGYWERLNQNEKLAVVGGGASLAYFVFRGGGQ